MILSSFLVIKKGMTHSVCPVLVLFGLFLIRKGITHSGFSVIRLGMENYVCKGKDKKNMMARASWGMNFHVGFWEGCSSKGLVCSGCSAMAVM